MATVILVRHGRSTANSTGVLAGRLPGVLLDATGEEQVRRVGERLSVVPLVRAVSSPLERCEQTARAIVDAQTSPPTLQHDERLTECGYGAWQGRSLKELAGEDLWRTVQRHPSYAVFPEGESIQAMAARAVEAIRAIDADVEAEHGAGAVWLAVSHGDVIKSILADAHGTHLDHFQRIIVDPASVSIVRFTADRPYVVATNTHAGDLSWLRPGQGEETSVDAVPGGGAGPSTSTHPA
ncbi:MSMEG_4193 family putative phosphomutase [Nocardioides daphniae]|uniref:MSMEG_4193 family putative phosphomutase n=1 Tax=Nocardioides daphniae TaxID=402297 RepID=A0A4P7UD91_9ACTN|nr:MSMEG_4193 family putative phosphomutase [Nocardioides daphniae]QCC77288.1 MSMEG_4193 family putative phosphomutase [Nocardioides daphniae]GGD25697.1 phosphoglycerate mutase [Nocardioides daphniae]